jgi:hypothetical protein
MTNCTYQYHVVSEALKLFEYIGVRIQLSYRLGRLGAPLLKNII